MLGGKEDKLEVSLVLGVKKFVGGLTSAVGSIKGFASRVGRALGTVSRVVKRTLKWVLGLGAAFTSLAVVGVRHALRAFADLETKVTEVGTLLDKWGPKVFGQIRDEAQKLAVQFGQTTAAMLRAKYDIVSAGFTKMADSARVLRTSLKAATAGLVDVGTASGLIISGLRGYQLAAKDATRVSDVFFTTVKYGRTTFAELAAFLPMVIPTAKAAGRSLTELGAAMATVTLGGINTAMAAVALNRMFMAMSAPSDDAAKALKRMGIVTRDAAGNMLPLIDIIRQMRGKRLSDIVDIAGSVRAARAILALANNYKTYVAILGHFQNVAGATDRAFAKMAGTLAFKGRQVRASMAVLWQAIGAAMSRPMKDAFDSLVKWFGDAVAAIRKHAPEIEAVTRGVINTIGAAAKATFSWIANAGWPMVSKAARKVFDYLGGSWPAAQETAVKAFKVIANALATVWHTGATAMHVFMGLFFQTVGMIETVFDKLGKAAGLVWDSFKLHATDALVAVMKWQDRVAHKIAFNAQMQDAYARNYKRLMKAAEQEAKRTGQPVTTAQRRAINIRAMEEAQKTTEEYWKNGAPGVKDPLLRQMQRDRQVLAKHIQDTWKDIKKNYADNPNIKDAQKQMDAAFKSAAAAWNAWDKLWYKTARKTGALLPKAKTPAPAGPPVGMPTTPGPVPLPASPAAVKEARAIGEQLLEGMRARISGIRRALGSATTPAQERALQTQLREAIHAMSAARRDVAASLARGRETGFIAPGAKPGERVVLSVPVTIQGVLDDRFFDKQFLPRLRRAVALGKLKLAAPG